MKNETSETHVWKFFPFSHFSPPPRLATSLIDNWNYVCWAMTRLKSPPLPPFDKSKAHLITQNQYWLTHISAERSSSHVSNDKSMHATFRALWIVENYHELKPNGQLQLTPSFDSLRNGSCLNARVEWKNPLQMLAFFFASIIQKFRFCSAKMTSSLFKRNRNRFASLKLADADHLMTL